MSESMLKIDEWSKLESEAGTVFEFFSDGFKPVGCDDFIRLTPREICQRPFIFKVCDIYFLGGGCGADIVQVLEKEHPGKVRNLGEWILIFFPGLSSEMMDKRLFELPMRRIADSNVSELVAKVRQFPVTVEAAS